MLLHHFLGNQAEITILPLKPALILLKEFLIFQNSEEAYAILC